MGNVYKPGWGKIRDIAYRYGIDTSTRIVSYRKRKYRYSKKYGRIRTSAVARAPNYPVGHLTGHLTGPRDPSFGSKPRLREYEPNTS